MYGTYINYCHFIFALYFLCFLDFFAAEDGGSVCRSSSKFILITNTTSTILTGTRRIIYELLSYFLMNYITSDKEDGECKVIHHY